MEEESLLFSLLKLSEVNTCHFWRVVLFNILQIVSSSTSVACNRTCIMSTFLTEKEESLQQKFYTYFQCDGVF